MMIGRVVDLSRRVDETTQVYPGDPKVRLSPATTLAAEGVNVLDVHLGSHSGTHVDAPYHFIEEGARVDELPLHLFVGPAIFMDVRGKDPRDRITIDDLEPYKASLLENRIAVVQTGWEKLYGTPLYYDHPFLDVQAASMLLNAGVRTIAIDALNVDKTVLEGEHPEGYPVHHEFLGVGGAIVENLANLEAVNFPDPFLSLLPIKLGGADGAPSRAVAMELLPRTDYS